STTNRSHQRLKNTQTNQTHGFRVSCNSTLDQNDNKLILSTLDQNDNKLILPESQNLVLPNVDRRNLLVGHGGLYTAANLPATIAAPVTSPDITSICKDANSGITNIVGAVRTRKCCPPSLGKTIKPFVFPSETTVRKRWPAHAGTKKQVDDYRRAIQAMRDLPDDHPHSFASQAKIHCAYCNGGYTQVENGFPEIDIQIHNYTRTNQTHGFRVSCNATQDDQNDNKLILPESQNLVLPNVDRRNLLVGLGGLYTAANLPAAIAAPVTSPDITSICKDANSGITNIVGAVRTRKCCPPSLGKTIKPFVFPTETTLINEPSFALPFWKWDEPAGMPMAEMFIPETIDGKPNSLYDVYRDVRHLPPSIVDLDFDGNVKDIPEQQQRACNLATVYRDLVRNGGDTLSFFGGEYVAGDKPVANGAKSVGSVEAGSHTAVHRWVGDSTQPNSEDMGNFYSAGYDPVFYCHHANVDRTWKLWKDLGLPGHVEPTDPDWLNASYVFYDENQELVRVYNKDCVDIGKLKYTFIENSTEVFPWRKSRPAKRRTSDQVASTGDVPTVDKVTFPVTLDNILKVRVKRPAVNRSKEDKAQANEILLINKIKFDSDKFVKFDVFVNDKVKDGVFTTPCDPEYAGGFAQIPHNDMKKMSMSSAARFGLTEILEDTNTEGEEYATVTLVPRVGCEDLTVGEISIKLVPIV
ncbi:hypothetical protein M8C21_024890, partial [Ambrosia artemisiifolia]